MYRGEEENTEKKERRYTLRKPKPKERLNL